MGLLWAILFAQIIFHAPKELHYFALAVAYGIAGAAIATLGTIFRVYFSFIFPMLATLITAFYFQGSFSDIVVALILLLGLGYLLYTSYKYSSHFQLMHESAERLRETEMEALVCLGKAGEYRDADIAAGKFLSTQGHAALSGLREQKVRRLAGLVPAEQETRFIVS